MKKFAEFFTESNGRLSSTRLLMALVLVLLAVDWGFALWTIGYYVISWEKVALISGVFGLKGVQKFMEGNTPEQPDYIDSSDNVNYRLEKETKKKPRRKY